MLQVQCHLLVIPYRHVEHLTALTPKERQDFFDTAILFQQKIRKSASGRGCDFRQHDRPFLPESAVKVNHVHGHLLLRSYGDVLYKEVQIFEQFRLLSPEDTRHEMEILKRMFLDSAP